MVINIFVCLLQVLLSNDQLCYQAEQIMSMCTRMVCMHTNLAVDLWVQLVTSVSIVFYSETEQRALRGFCPQPPRLLPLLPPASSHRNWLLTDARLASLLLEKNPPAAPELPLLLQ